ncbi:hypothetical protein QZH41_014307 [Actinostola sp. cb2023]|nr:hypothetical protein QZH41_014307 [Actinostola sp. cb2023]
MGKSTHFSIVRSSIPPNGGIDIQTCWFKEACCVILTGLLSMPCGVIQFIFVYHIPHDVCGIHTEVLVCIMIAVYALIVWRSDRNPALHSRGETVTTTVKKQTKGRYDGPTKRSSDEISLNVILHFIFYVLLVIFAKPQNVVFTGLHQEVGNCSQTTAVHTPLGQVLYKNTYLCLNNYDEAYFDWHCSHDNQHMPGSKWYTLCGTPYPNHMEYILVVCAFCLLGCSVYYQMLWYSANNGVDSLEKLKKN